jgi:hypothetical protein
MAPEWSVRQAPEWKGRNKPHRGDRRWVEAWSPEQFANRLPIEFPYDESMRISHEAIYQALYVLAWPAERIDDRCWSSAGNSSG